MGAALIVVVLTVVAVLGIRESARVTGVLVIVKVAICVFVDRRRRLVRAGRQPDAVHPAGPARRRAAAGWRSRSSRRSPGSNPPSSASAACSPPPPSSSSPTPASRRSRTSPRRPAGPAATCRSGLLGTLGVATALYIGVSFVVVGMVKYTDIDEGAPIADAFDQVGLGWASALVSHRRRRRADLGDPGRPGDGEPDRLRDGPRRAAARRRSPR